ISTTMSAQGIPRKNILDEWLRLNILYKEQVEAIDVMKNRKEQLSQRITDFAPLGAELARLEREVKVNENQYLSLLHGLNQARLRQYDLETTPSQTLIDEPLFPKKPLPSKRKILVAGGALGTGFMVVSMLFMIALMDSTVRSAQRAHQLTGLPVAAAWPNISTAGETVKDPLLHTRLIKQFYNQAWVFLQHNKGKKVLVFYSIEAGEGKTYLLKQAAEELIRQGKTVTAILPERSSQGATHDNIQSIFYSDSRLNGLQWQQIREKAQGEVLLFEHPNIQMSNIHFDLMNQADLIVLVLDASRPWSSSDQAYLDNVCKGLIQPQVIWLNKMAKEDLEDINGIIPKKRGKIRAFAKRLLT